MQATMIKKSTLGVFAYISASFLVQAISHFVVNADHFAGIGFMRQEPIMALGIGTMVIQGIVLTYLYTLLSKNGSSVRHGFIFGLLFGIFLVSYIALVEPSKYMVPSISSWVAVEGSAGLVQFGLFGILLGLIFSKK